MSLLQSYEIKKPVQQIQPLEHYKGKPSAHGWVINAVPQLTLNYVMPGQDLPGSDVEAVLRTMVGVERSFQPAAAQIPISLSITKQPRAPLSWNVTYLFPQGDVKDYCQPLFEFTVDVIRYDPLGVLAWQLQANMPNQFYGTHDADRVQIEGFVLGDLELTIEATTDFEIVNYDQPAGMLTEGLVLDINPHTLMATVNQTEDTNLEPVWQYTWTFGVN